MVTVTGALIQSTFRLARLTGYRGFFNILLSTAALPILFWEGRGERWV